MRGTVAKRIRRKVYGLQSLRTPRQYKKLASGQIVAVGLRRVYQREKTEYKRVKSGHGGQANQKN